MQSVSRWLVAGLCLLASVGVKADDNTVLKAGGSLQPFTSNVVTGPYRGQQHCYVCELVAAKPVVLVFSRTLDATTASLLRNLNGMTHAHKAEGFFSWFVVVGKAGSEEETALEGKAEAFANQNKVGFVPVSVLGDRRGPPGYAISPKADIVVFLAQGRKILAVRSYAVSQWNDKAVADVQNDILTVLHVKS